MKCFIDLQTSVEANKEKCGKEEIGKRKTREKEAKAGIRGGQKPKGR